MLQAIHGSMAAQLGERGVLPGKARLELGLETRAGCRQAERRKESFSHKKQNCLCSYLHNWEVNCPRTENFPKRGKRSNFLKAAH